MSFLCIMHNGRKRADECTQAGNYSIFESESSDVAGVFGPGDTSCIVLHLISAWGPLYITK